MKPEDILKLIKEAGVEAVEGLGAMESMGKNLTIAGQALEAASRDAKKVMEVAGRISKRITPHRS